MTRDAYEQDREDLAVREQDYVGPDVEPSEFLDLATRTSIRQIVLAAQIERYRALADACERTRWEAECLYEQFCAELNALGGEPN